MLEKEIKEKSEKMKENDENKNQILKIDNESENNKIKTSQKKTI